MNPPTDTTRRPALKSLGALLPQATQKAFRKHGFAEARLLTDWLHIAGPLLGTRSQPLTFSHSRQKQEGGVLTVAVESGWALEMQHLEPVLLEKIATYFGYKAVAKIRLQQRTSPLYPRQNVALSPPESSSPPPSSSKLDAPALSSDRELSARLTALGRAMGHLN